MTETGREAATMAPSAAPTPSWLARLGSLTPIASGPRLVIAFTLTGIIAGLAFALLSGAVSRSSFPVAMAYVCLFVAPLLWKGVHQFLYAIATLGIALLLAEALGLKQDRLTPILLCAAVIALVRGFNQPGMRALAPIIGGLSGAWAMWGLNSWLEDWDINFDFALVFLPAWFCFFWAAAGCGDWLASAIASRWHRRRAERRFEAKTSISRFVAWARSLVWESLPLTAGLALGVALCVEVVLFFTWGVQSTVGKLAVDALIVACLLLVARGSTHFGVALLLLMPLGVESISAGNRGLALSVALVPVCLWGLLHDWPLRKAITATAGITLGAVLLFVVAFFLPEPIKAKAVGGLDGFLGYASARVSVVALVAVLLQRYTVAIDALRDWFAAEGDARIPAPSSEMGGLTPGDIGLLQARVLLPGTTVRVLAMSVLILAAVFPFSMMRLRSKRSPYSPTPGDARSALVVGTTTYVTFSEGSIERKVAISRKVTFEEFVRVTGLRPPFGVYDEKSPVLLSLAWFGLPLDAAREYCDELSRIEGLMQCYSQSERILNTRQCDGYRLPTQEEWKGLVALVKSGAYGSLVDDVDRGSREFVMPSLGVSLLTLLGKSSVMGCGGSPQAEPPGSEATSPAPEDCVTGVDSASFRVVRTLSENELPNGQQ